MLYLYCLDIPYYIFIKLYTYVCFRSIIVPWRNILRSFSVISGERITDYEGSDDYIFSAHFCPSNPKLLIACNIKGEIFCWKWKTELLISKKKLNIDLDEVNEFLLMPVNERLDKDVYEMLVAWTKNNEHHVGIFRSDGKKPEQLNMKIKNKRNKFVVGGSKKSKFIAMIENNKLHCLNLQTKRLQKWSTGKNKTLTCISCPKEELYIATGDSLGRIIVWYNLFHEKPSQSIYHWHTLPVRCLTFSESGNTF